MCVNRKNNYAGHISDGYERYDATTRYEMHFHILNATIIDFAGFCRGPSDYARFFVAANQITRDFCRGQ